MSRLNNGPMKLSNIPVTLFSLAVVISVAIVFGYFFSYFLDLKDLEASATMDIILIRVVLGICVMGLLFGTRFILMLLEHMLRIK